MQNVVQIYKYYNIKEIKDSKPCQAYIAVSQCAGVQSSGEKKGMVPDPSHWSLWTDQLPFGAISGRDNQEEGSNPLMEPGQGGLCKILNLYS